VHGQESAEVKRLEVEGGKPRKLQRKPLFWPLCNGLMIPGTMAGDARAIVVDAVSLRAAERVVEVQIERDAHLMSDEAKAGPVAKISVCHN
jgi:hypothetical protein